MNTFLDKEGLSKYHERLTGKGNITSMSGYNIAGILHSTGTPPETTFDYANCKAYDVITVFTEEAEPLHFEIGDTISVKCGNNFNDWANITDLVMGDTGNDVTIYIDKPLPLTDINVDAASKVVYCNAKPQANKKVSSYTTIDEHQTCFGYYNQSSMWAAFSCGYGNKSIGRYSFTCNQGNTAAHASCVSGYNNTCLSHYSFMTGQDNSTTGDCRGSFVAGRNNHISADLDNMSNYNTIFGQENSIIHVGTNNFVNGYKNTVSGESTGNFVTGLSNTLLTGKYNLISGCLNKPTSANYSLLTGSENTLSGDRDIIGGYKNTLNGNNSVCFGIYSTVTHDSTLSIGNHLTSTSSYSLICGRYNHTSNKVLFAVGDGCGSSGKTRPKFNNAFEVIAADDYTTTPAYCRVSVDPIHPFGVATKQYVDNKFQVLESLPTTTNNDTIYFILEA